MYLSKQLCWGVSVAFSDPSRIIVASFLHRLAIGEGNKCFNQILTLHLLRTFCESTLEILDCAVGFF